MASEDNPIDKKYIAPDGSIKWGSIALNELRTTQKEILAAQKAKAFSTTEIERWKVEAELRFADRIYTGETKKHLLR